MPGFLVPDHYVVVPPTTIELHVVSIIWGFTLCIGVFSGSKAFRQTRSQWRRSRRVTPYAMLVWAEWLVSMVIGFMTWFFLTGYIEPSFQFYFILLCFWVVQIQSIPGIIVNRIELLMVNKRQAAKLRWGAALILGLVNISVFVIWIPAQLQISETWIKINFTWDRIEKGIFLLVDATLHIYFIYLIHVKLIANGLTKYMPLYKFNLVMVIFSISLDCILIGTMSIGAGFVYTAFHPLVYMLKLHIEMNISSLIVKVVRATGESSSYKGGEYELGTELQGKAKTNTGTGRSGVLGATNNTAGQEVWDKKNDVHVEAGNESMAKPMGGIMKSVQTRVTVTTSRKQDDEDDENSSQSSTRQLKRDSHAYHQF